ncbi:beta-1,6-N-acetylglucosaminyltransferase [Duganella sp. HH105]|uniref:beta-1,6-N-acetylglucosaminyltransferase n=1 Tax=Duganella sp. HH105 TaxID=1781067 RepID=UPI000877CD80|nr:beta-1,6-N-acetylglucosaminyltransferase [Duganella sp. HH105]OEZ61619.1 core-2/I-branching enzyme [Duganella sp. HH105]
MKVAYLILAHDQPELFGRLISALQYPGVSIYALIDGKKEQLPFEQAAAEHAVHFVSDRVKVNWAGYSQVEAMLALLQAATAAGGHDAYIFLSGRDYPIQSNEALFSHLQRHPGMSFMNFYQLSDGTDFVHLIKKYAFRDFYSRLPSDLLRKVVRYMVDAVNFILPPRKFVKGMLAYRGSTSWCLSGAAANYIVNFVKQPQNKGFIRFFRMSSGADEIFFQTILLNSALAPSCAGYQEPSMKDRSTLAVNENKVSLHYIDWNPERENPAILEQRDLAGILQSGKFFARKMDGKRSAELLQSINSMR